MRDKNTDICAVGQHAALHGPGKGLIHRQGNEIETKAATLINISHLIYRNDTHGGSENINNNKKNMLISTVQQFNSWVVFKERKTERQTKEKKNKTRRHLHLLRQHKCCSSKQEPEFDWEGRMEMSLRCMLEVAAVSAEHWWKQKDKQSNKSSVLLVCFIDLI